MRLCEIKGIKAGCILSAVGSLQKLNLRLASGSKTYSRDQKYEIVSATGTIAENGCHVHLSVSDSNGEVVGGHLIEKNEIYTTCELIILEIFNVEFHRELDSATTFNELKIYLTKS